MFPSILIQLENGPIEFYFLFRPRTLTCWKKIGKTKQKKNLALLKLRVSTMDKMPPKDADGIADSEDTDRLLLEKSSLIWVCPFCPDLSD